VNKFAMMLLNW